MTATTPYPIFKSASATMSETQASNQSALSTPLTAADYLANLQVVMVNTTLPANIGSAARAMHTMGLSRLTVVAPKLPIDDSSVSHAAGGQHLLEEAKVVDTLEEAVASCQLVFAASSRSRHLPRPVVTPAQAADIMMNFIDAHRGHSSTLPVQPTLPTQANSNTQSPTTPQQQMTPVNIAIVFGREDRGLTNEELALADYHIQIQANPAYPVLNVAAAVQVIASFIYAQIQTHLDKSASLQTISESDKLASEPSPSTTPSYTADGTQEQLLTMMIRQVWDEPAISHQQAQQLTERLIELMLQLDLANPDDLRSLPQRISRFSSRMQLDQKEYQLLSAVIAKLLKLSQPSQAD